jgi:hypothetical protein
MKIPVPADNRILYFERERDSFRYFSHFHPSPIELDGETWPTAEHYYQAQRSDDPAYRQAIRETEWAISSHTRFGAPRSEDVALLVRTLVIQTSTLGIPMKSDPSTPLPTYVPGREHLGTIRSYPDLTPVSKAGMAYWPIYRKPVNDPEKFTWKDAPFAYAYRDDNGKWKVTFARPVDQTPWYRA